MGYVMFCITPYFVCKQSRREKEDNELMDSVLFCITPYFVYKQSHRKKEDKILQHSLLRCSCTHTYIHTTIHQTDREFGVGLCCQCNYAQGNVAVISKLLFYPQISLNTQDASFISFKSCNIVMFTKQTAVQRC